MGNAPAFVLFGPAHVAAIVLAVATPLALMICVRRGVLGDRWARRGLALLLSAGWLGVYVMFALRGWLSVDDMLPLNLCDWAAAVMIAALLTRAQLAYELGYFWGLCGTLQGLLTPDLAYGFPDPAFVLFMLDHGGIIAALLYLTLAGGMRPVMASIPRVLAVTLAYTVVAGLADGLTGADYGFLRAPPAHPSLISLLSPWPWYIPELAGIAVILVGVCYAPFLIRDRVKGREPPHPVLSRP